MNSSSFRNVPGAALTPGAYLTVVQKVARSKARTFICRVSTKSGTSTSLCGGVTVSSSHLHGRS
eukprot:1783301-Prymnesium_polylepis.1